MIIYLTWHGLQGSIAERSTQLLNCFHQSSPWPHLIGLSGVCDTVGHFFLMTSPLSRTQYGLSGNLTFSLLFSASFYNVLFKSLFGVPSKSAYLFRWIIITINNHTLIDNIQSENSSADFPPKFWTYASDCLWDIVLHGQTDFIYTRHTFLWKFLLLALTSELHARIWYLCAFSSVIYQATSLELAQSKWCYIFVKWWMNQSIQWNEKINICYVIQ